MFDGLKGWIRRHSNAKRLEKENTFLVNETKRPEYGLFPTLEEKGIQIPQLPVLIQDIYQLAQLSGVLRTIHFNLKQEIFRKGFTWLPNFAVKCKSCGKEYKKTVEKCDCGGEVRLPDKNQLDAFEKFMAKANENKQTFLDVCKECELDLEIIDDAYLIILKEYMVDDEGVQYEKIKEIIRGDPVLFRIVGDKYGNLGGKYFVCLEHREVAQPEAGTCPICNKPLFDAIYVSTESDENPQQYYVEGEIIHVSKYNPSLLYGWSPILSIWKETSTLLNMVNYVNEYYRHMRAPKGIVIAHTSNPDAVYKKWDEIREKIKDDPFYTPLLAIETDEGSSEGKLEFVQFSNPLQEMQYIQAKDDLRQRMSALYGVTNILMADSAGMGGLNNEGLQIKVTDRAVEVGQAVWEINVYPRLMSMFGITDYCLELLPNEEVDNEKEMNLKLQKVQEAQMMVNMGFDVKLDVDGEFEFSGEAKKPEEGIGGMMGGEQEPLFGGSESQEVKQPKRGEGEKYGRSVM
jgi:hypothetical protein